MSKDLRLRVYDEVRSQNLNDYRFDDESDLEVAEDMVAFDAGLENYRPEDLVAFIADWREVNVQKSGRASVYGKR
jgi:hypothetical protein